MSALCPDCGTTTSSLLCAPCTKVAASLGFTVEERLERLGVPVLDMAGGRFSCEPEPEEGAPLW